MKGFPRKPFPPGAFPPGYQPDGLQRQARHEEDGSQFRELSASKLYCPKCKEATPVRERLLLVLPSGDRYDYLCTQCGESVGEKTSS